MFFRRATARPLSLQRVPLPRERYRLALLAVLAAVWLVLVWAAQARADAARAPDFLVIVNSGNPTSEVTFEFVADAFLKKTTRWGHGESIRPVDQASDSQVRRHFSRSVLKRSVAAVRSYWQQRIFTGRDVPPPELDSDEEVVRYVAKYLGAIGYVAPNNKLPGVKVLTLSSR